MADWQVNLAGWKMRQVREFNETLKKVRDELAVGLLYPQLAAVITAWPYEGLSPAKVEDYDELTPEQWTETLSKVQDALAARFRRAE